MTPQRLRDEVTSRLLPPETEPPPGTRGRRGPWPPARSRRPPRRRRIPFTPQARRVFDLAAGEALALGHNYIGCEHLLLAVAVSDGIAADALKAVGLDIDRLRQGVIEATDAIEAARAEPPARPRTERPAGRVPAVITVLAGGVGAARFLAGLVQVRPPDEITAIVNVGDDVELHGLHISPDLDTITYTLAGAIDPERGWGLAGETWQAMEALGRYRRRAPGSASATATSPPTCTAPTACARARRSPRSPPRSPPAWGLGLRLLPGDRRPRCAPCVTVDGATARRDRLPGVLRAARSTTSPVTRRALRRRRRGPARRPACSRRSPTAERVVDRAVEPARVDRPGARRARRARRGRRPPRPTWSPCPRSSPAPR